MIEVIEPGFMTSVQDLGRHGLQRYGVIVSGAMDTVALRIGNILVGNAENEASLEMTLLGPELCFREDTLIAITGRGLSPKIEGQDVPMWRPVFVRAGVVLSFEPRIEGCRGYLAVAGGIAVPKVMSSKSTYLRAGVGGYEGRLLQAGDVLATAEPSQVSQSRMNRLAGETPFCAPKWAVSVDVLPQYRIRPALRVVWGLQRDLFTAESLEVFQSEKFLVTAQSDRMGYRLTGPKLSLREPHELISEAVSAGTIQVPAEGNPIVLMADHQTTGGYPKIAQVASVDLPVLAQVRPGESVSFQVISLEEAQLLFREQEAEIEAFRLGLQVFDR